jgi:hypothetical protein
MEIDYSPFLHVCDDGKIWWPLPLAAKLGAGYLPMRDDAQVLAPDLRATNNRVLANERTLLSEFAPGRRSAHFPFILERDDGRFVEAQEFLVWLARYLDDEADSGFKFPLELALAVTTAKARHAEVDHSASLWSSLAAALEGRYEEPFDTLPVDLQARVHDEIHMPPWNVLSPESRRKAAKAADARRDRGNDAEDTFWWGLVLRKQQIEATLNGWRDDTHASGELRLERERKTPAMKRELAMIARVDRVVQRGQGQFRAPEEGTAMPASETVRYVAYPKALHELKVRLKATPDELAAWVLMGPSHGGIAAYLNANELNPPKRFHFGVGVGSEQDFDYLTPLMGCWFREDELRAFSPKDRYLTGKVLVERWSGIPGIQPEAFISAKIRESRLLDLHPITGGTQATDIGNEGFPPLTSGLFLLQEVEAIEAADFPAAESEVSVGAISSLPPVTALEIRLNFAVFRDYDRNQAWWKEMMSHAKQNGLSQSRIGTAQRGQSGGSLWRADLVAAWLLDRAPKHRGGMTDKSIRAALAKFEGYEQAAEDFVIEGD